MFVAIFTVVDPLMCSPCGSCRVLIWFTTTFIIKCSFGKEIKMKVNEVDSDAAASGAAAASFSASSSVAAPGFTIVFTVDSRDASAAKAAAAVPAAAALLWMGGRTGGNLS